MVIIELEAFPKPKKRSTKSEAIKLEREVFERETKVPMHNESSKMKIFYSSRSPRIQFKKMMPIS